MHFSLLLLAAILSGDGGDLLNGHDYAEHIDGVSRHETLDVLDLNEGEALSSYFLVFIYFLYFTSHIESKTVVVVDASELPISHLDRAVGEEVDFVFVDSVELSIGVLLEKCSLNLSAFSIH